MPAVRRVSRGVPGRREREELQRTHEEYRQRYRNAVQQHLQEPVLAVGVFNRPGGTAAMRMTKISPVAGMLMRKQSKKDAGGLPTTVALAVTPTRVHVYRFNATASSVDVDDELMT